MKPPFNVLQILAGAISPSLLIWVAATIAADEWPVVRGDTLGSGVGATMLSDDLQVLWTYHAEKGTGFDATPVISGGVIFVGDSSGTMHAIRLGDGAQVWTKPFKDTSFLAGAAIENDRIYVGDMDGVVRCLSTAGGEEVWSQRLDAEIYAGPTPYHDTILVTSQAGTLSCLRAADGKEGWRPFKIDAPLRCTPTISAGRVMLAGCDSRLHVIDAATGQQVQTIEIDGPTGSTPAMHGDRVYFGTESGTFFAIDVPEAADKEPAIAWTFRDAKRPLPIRSAAAASDQLITFGSQGKMIYGLDPNSGELKWQLTTRSRVESSPVIAGQRVVAATTAGKVYLLDSINGEVKWEYDAGGGFTASPAVVDGRIILPNTDGTLYCLGKGHEHKSATEATENKN